MFHARSEGCIVLILNPFTYDVIISVWGEASPLPPLPLPPPPTR